MEEEKPPLGNEPPEDDKGYDVAPRDDEFGAETPDAGIYPAPSAPIDKSPLPEGVIGIPSEEEDAIAAEQARNNPYPPDPDDGRPRPAIDIPPATDEEDHPLPNDRHRNGAE